MKKILLHILLITYVAASSLAFAGKDDHLVIQEAANNVVTVQQAFNLKDETGVTLTGKIVQHLKGEHYLLRDQTGTIQLEIDDDLWRAARLTVGDHVRAVGEVDTHRYKPTDIEVLKIEKIRH